MKFIATILFFCCSTYCSTVSEYDAHEFHLSKTTLNYDSETESLQITMHLFIDDMELSLSKIGYDSLSLFTKAEVIEADDYVQEYINTHFQVSIDKEPLLLDFIGKEMSDDLSGMYCYLEIVDVQLPSKIHIKNDIMIEIFDDQMNIVNLKVDKRLKEDFLFDKNTIEEKVNL